MIAELNGTDLYYEQEGSGPDVLLLPGLGATAHVWYPQMKALSGVMRLTAMDPRGHGRSGRPMGPYSTRLFSEDAAALIRRAGIAPAVVVGSSMSAATAIDLAAHHPDLVSALVLVGGFAVLPAAARERFEQRAVLAETDGMEPVADLVVQGALGATSHAVRPALVALFRQAVAANDRIAYAAAARAVRDIDVRALLPRVTCPTLILIGAEEVVAPMSAARALKAGIPHADVVVLPEAGHLPFLEQPAAFNAALQAFVAGLPHPAS